MSKWCSNWYTNQPENHSNYRFTNHPIKRAAWDVVRTLANGPRVGFVLATTWRNSAKDTSIS